MAKDVGPADILKNVRPTPVVENGLSDTEKVRVIAEHFRGIMETLGLDLKNESLSETPHRIARMYIHELFRGLSTENFPKVSVIPNEFGYDQMIIAKKVNIKSVCEHHFQTIDGIATIAYIPKDRVIGLSKMNRIADYFARRPQVQERLTKQIADALSYILQTDHIAVHIDARHYCLVSRGVEDAASTTVTCDLRGDFYDKDAVRREFFAAVK
jgi:GTP cyclohydrolase I